MADDDTTPDRPRRAHRKRTAPPKKASSFGLGFATLRDLLSFVAGMTIIGHEVLISATVDPYAVGVGVALTGLPIVFGGESKGASK